MLTNCEIKLKYKDIKQHCIIGREAVFKTNDIDRIVEMAWEDRTPFEAIRFQFGLLEKDVIRLMRSELKSGSFKRWRKRVNKGKSKKHLKKRNPEIKRFRCSRQKAISTNRISKR
ncbi:MAG: TIGR03643 family protein [Flavobacteriaceae bacterium]|nr:TIGR03643 family protein [Flavobacteriaceae bacterium]